MKRNLLFLLMAFITLSFVACDDDDKINDDNQGGNGAITVEWATNADFDTLAIEPDMAGKAVIEIKAEAGIKSLKLNINSPALTDEVLGLVGLSTSVDLATVELNETQAGIVAGLPFGDAVLNQTAVTFDVSNLVPMILALPNNAGYHVFSIVITDNNNNTVEKNLVFSYAQGVITFEWASNPDFDTLAIESNMAGKAIIDIESNAGIKSLMLNIKSPALTDMILGVVGLSTSIDLATVELTADQAALLAGVPFGDAVLNQTAVTFDVSNLVPMILELPNNVGDHVFSITVTDNTNNTASRELVFNYKEPANLSVSEINLWANTALVTAKGLSETAKVQYREKGTEAWQEAIANANGTYTIAPVWNENTNEAGLKVYTPAEGTGVWVGKTYEYRILEGETETFSSTFAPEGTGDIIPNGDMSSWSFKDGSLPYPNAEGDTLWDSGNNSMTAAMGIVLCQEDTETKGVAFLKAGFVKLGLMQIFTPGNMFTGSFNMAGVQGTASFGVPYAWTARPKALKVRVKAEVGKIDQIGSSDTEGAGLNGQQDKSVIFAAVVDWTARHGVTSGLGAPSGMWHPAQADKLDEGAIFGYASHYIEGNTNGYEEIEIPFEWYNNTDMPSNTYALVISCATSYRGDYLTGCSTNKMWIDSFEWVY